MFSAPEFVTIVSKFLNVDTIALAQVFVHLEGKDFAGWRLIGSLKYN